MKNIYQKIPIGIMHVIVTSVIVIASGCSCTSENEIFHERENNSAEIIYEKFVNRKKISLFNLSNSGETKGEILHSAYIPFISIEDLKKLSSLNYSEMVYLKEYYLNKIGESRIEASDCIETENYEYVFNLLGGHEGMDKLFVFFNNYLQEEGSKNNLLKLLPDNLSHEEICVYVGMGIFVDNIARPVYSILTNSKNLCENDNEINTRSGGSTDRLDCKIDLGAKLAIMGVGITVESFLDAAAGGAITELQADSAVLGLTDIWLSYEACNGRWH